MPAKFPTLKTTRLNLREHDASDVESYFEILSDGATVRYYGKLPLATVSEAVKEIELLQDQYKQGHLIKWAIEDMKSGKYLGSVGAFGLNNQHFRVTLSCIINPLYWGMGIAKEALMQVLDYLFTQSNINRVQVYVDPVNNRAVNLFNGLGFLREGLLREYEYEYGAPIDLIIMSLLKKEWNLKESY